MKTLKINFNDDWLILDTKLGVDDVDGIFHIVLSANPDGQFLHSAGLGGIQFKMFRDVDKLMYQFDNDAPIDTTLGLTEGNLVLNFDSKIPGNNFTFLGVNGQKIKIFAE